MAKNRKTPVQFTLESSERIGRVVRAAETARAPSRPLSFEPFFDGRKTRQVRAATFSGTWPVGSAKVVTFKNAPTATATVTNLSWPITGAHSNDDCIVGKDGTSWYLVVPVLATATASFATTTQQKTFAVGFSSRSIIDSLAISANLDTNSCAITVHQTASTASITVVTQTATGILVTSGFTSTFLKIKGA